MTSPHSRLCLAQFPRKRPQSARRPRSPRPRQRDPTPAWRSSNRHPASTSRQPPHAASPAMPASWGCATPPTARSSTAAAEPAPSPPRYAAPSRAGIATSVSSPAATAATATPITSCTGPMAGRRSSQTWFPSADSTTGRCMKKAFRWSLPPRDSSGSCARMASRCRRCHRQPAGREHRWRRPWHAWPRGRHHHRSRYRYPRVVRRVAGRGGGARGAVGTAGCHGALRPLREPAARTEAPAPVERTAIYGAELACVGGSAGALE